MIFHTWMFKHFPNEQPASLCLVGWIDGLYPTNDGAIIHTRRGGPLTLDADNAVRGYLPAECAVITSFHSGGGQQYITTVDKADQINELEDQIKEINKKIGELLDDDPDFEPIKSSQFPPLRRTLAVRNSHL